MDSNNKYKKITKNTLLFALGTFGSKAISFFLVPLYTNILTTTEYGIADLILVFTGLLGPVFSFQVAESILYFNLRSDDKTDKESIFKNSIAIVLIGCIVLTALGPVWGLYETLRNYRYFMVAYVAFYMLRNTMLMYTKSLEFNHIYALDNIIYALVVAALNLFFLLVLKWGVIGYLLSYIMAEALSFSWLFIYNHGFSVLVNYRIDKAIIKNLLVYSVPLIINSVSWTISSSTDRFMLNHFLSTGSVGVYSVAQKIPTILQTCMSFFLQAWTISAYLEVENKDNKFYESIFKIFTFVIAITISFILLIVKPFMKVYVGGEFFEGYLYVPFLLLSASFQMFAAYFGSIIQSGKKNYFMTISTLVGAFVNIIMNYFLILKYQVMGAVIATTISYIVVFLLRFKFSRKITKFYINVNKMILMYIVLFIQSISIVTGFNSLTISIVSFLTIVLINLSEIKSIFILLRHKFIKD